MMYPGALDDCDNRTDVNLMACGYFPYDYPDDEPGFTELLLWTQQNREKIWKGRQCRDDDNFLVRRRESRWPKR